MTVTVIGTLYMVASAATYLFTMSTEVLRNKYTHRHILLSLYIVTHHHNVPLFLQRYMTLRPQHHHYPKKIRLKKQIPLLFHYYSSNLYQYNFFSINLSWKYKEFGRYFRIKPKIIWIFREPFSYLVTTFRPCCNLLFSYIHV